MRRARGSGSRSRACLGIALVPALLGTGAAPAQEIRVLVAEEVKQALAGNTSEIPVRAGGAIYVYYDPDGSARGVFPSLGLDGGVWWVTESGDYCAKWVKLRNGVPACNPLLKEGDRYRWGEAVFRILPGNPRNL